MKRDATDFRPAAQRGRARQSAQAAPLRHNPANPDHIELARHALIAQSQAVQRSAARLGQPFNDAVNRILACKGHVVVCGMGKSGHVGKKLAATLASTGTPSFYLHPAEAFHGDLGMLTSTDIVILISNSGETEEVIKLIPSLKRFGNQIIAMAGKGDSTLARHADVWLDVSVDREVCPNNLAPTTSTLVTMAMGDALAVALINARRFQPADFAQFHPGGSLGRMLLTRVRDVMQTRLPLVTSTSSVRECLFTMTRQRLGMVIVQDGKKLVGILTDGDLRRALLKDGSALDKNVTEFVSKRPIGVDADSTLANAERVMREKHVRVLLVTEGSPKRLCGVLEIFGHDDAAPASSAVR